MHDGDRGDGGTVTDEVEGQEALSGLFERQRTELLREISRAVSAPRPDLVRLPQNEELSDEEWNAELLTANSDRLLGYLRDIQTAYESRVWFSRPAMDAKTEVTRERKVRLAGLGDFCLEVADALEESLTKDLRDLGYRDKADRFGLGFAPSRRGFLRR
jgi:hypothetical protein